MHPHRPANRRACVVPGHAAVKPARYRAAVLLDFDNSLGVDRLAGADEAGRGCMAGPLVAAAVCLDLRLMSSAARDALSGLDDSKRLTPRRRRALVGAVMMYAEQVVVISASARTIDADGLHRTNLRALAGALAGITPAADLALVDGFDLGPQAPAHRKMIKGDATSAAIAAASVIAKEARDRLMRGPAALLYPAYGFDGHVGYITVAHKDAVRTHGPSPLHRLSVRSDAYAKHLTLFAE